MQGFSFWVRDRSISENCRCLFFWLVVFEDFLATLVRFRAARGEGVSGLAVEGAGFLWCYSIGFFIW